MKNNPKNSQNLHNHQKDMIKSGFNWKVEKRPLFDEKGNKLRIEGTFRSDNDFFLGAVTKNYHIVDNEELFKFPQEIVKAGEKVEFSGAHSLNGGETVMVRYKLPHIIDVKKVGDIVETELIISTSHNGKGSVLSAVNTNRLVCTNGMKTSEKSFSSSVRHSSSADERLTIARNTVKHIGTQVKQFSELANTFADTKLNTDDIRQIVEKVYYKDDTSNIYTSAVKQNQARTILGIFETNDDNTFKSQRGTAWNLLNAFTNFTDHRMNYRTNELNNEDQAKIRGKFFGVGNALKFVAIKAIATVIHKNHSINFPAEYLL